MTDLGRKTSNLEKSSCILPLKVGFVLKQERDALQGRRETIFCSEKFFWKFSKFSKFSKNIKNFEYLEIFESFENF